MIDHDRVGKLQNTDALKIPSAARLYDYYLGGNFNLEADRALAKQIYQVMPEMPYLARENRKFLQRAVRYCAELGISQYLDLGCGLPTVGPVHEIARKSRPDSKVLYVDNEPVAVEYSKMILEGIQDVEILHMDFRNVEEVLNSEPARRLIDFTEPVALMMVSVWHFIPDSDHPADVLKRYRAALAPDSHLILSHVSGDTLDKVSGAADLYKNSQNPVTLRTRSEVTGMFAGFALVDPGVVFVPEWRPETPEDAEGAERCSFYGGVAQVP
ncbi:MAG: SAM-dependent methyltransferase [Sciscionella sp.]